MIAALALCVSGIALGVAAFAVWLARNQAVSAQRLAKEASRLADGASKVQEAAALTMQAQAEALNREAVENREALTIAERSATAAEESARATRILAESGQRAYVGLGALQVLRSDLSTGFPTVVRGEIRNTGKTPAFSVSSWQWLQRLAEFPADPEYTGLESIQPADLGPGAVQTAEAGNDFGDARAAQAVRNRELTVFLFGISRYTDIFGIPHQTRWAFSWNLEKRQFTRCAQHNDMN